MAMATLLSAPGHNVFPSHHSQSSVGSCHWGFFEAKLKPVLTIASGDEVTIDTISGGPDVVPDRSRFHVPPELDEVHAKNERMVPGHILTGPVAVEGAEPGDVLEVEILDVRLRQDWGFNLIRPLSGTLPDDFHETRLLNIPLDQKRMVGSLPWRLDLPLRPFFGVMGVAPPPAWGRITSLIPRAMGGNLDNKELIRGRSFICRCSCRARYFRAATVTAPRATATSASPQSRPRCRAVSN
jgi:acetamidase/formamidase